MTINNFVSDLAEAKKVVNGRYWGAYAAQSALGFGVWAGMSHHFKNQGSSHHIAKGWAASIPAAVPTGLGLSAALAHGYRNPASRSARMFLK